MQCCFWTVVLLNCTVMFIVADTGKNQYKKHKIIKRSIQDSSSNQVKRRNKENGTNMYRRKGYSEEYNHNILNKRDKGEKSKVNIGDLLGNDLMELYNLLNISQARIKSSQLKVHRSEQQKVVPVHKRHHKYIKLASHLERSLVETQVKLQKLIHLIRDTERRSRHRKKKRLMHKQTHDGPGNNSPKNPTSIKYTSKSVYAPEVKKLAHNFNNEKGIGFRRPGTKGHVGYSRQKYHSNRNDDESVFDSDNDGSVYNIESTSDDDYSDGNWGYRGSRGPGASYNPRFGEDTSEMLRIGHASRQHRGGDRSGKDRQNSYSTDEYTSHDTELSSGNDGYWVPHRSQNTPGYHPGPFQEVQGYPDNRFYIPGRPNDYPGFEGMVSIPGGAVHGVKGAGEITGHEGFVGIYSHGGSNSSVIPGKSVHKPESDVQFSINLSIPDASGMPVYASEAPSKGYTLRDQSKQWNEKTAGNGPVLPGKTVFGPAKLENPLISVGMPAINSIPPENSPRAPDTVNGPKRDNEPIALGMSIGVEWSDGPNPENKPKDLNKTRYGPVDLNIPGNDPVALEMSRFWPNMPEDDQKVPEKFENVREMPSVSVLSGKEENSPIRILASVNLKSDHKMHT